MTITGVGSDLNLTFDISLNRSNVWDYSSICNLLIHIYIRRTSVTIYGRVQLNTLHPNLTFYPFLYNLMEMNCYMFTVWSGGGTTADTITCQITFHLRNHWRGHGLTVLVLSWLCLSSRCHERYWCSPIGILLFGFVFDLWYHRGINKNYSSCGFGRVGFATTFHVFAMALFAVTIGPILSC